MREFNICDSPRPNLLRDIFPYSEAPRIKLGHPLLPPSPAREMFITDSTFREGQQASPLMNPGEARDLFDMLHRLSGPEGVIRHTEFFLYTARDRRLGRNGWLGSWLLKTFGITLIFTAKGAVLAAEIVSLSIRKRGTPIIRRK